MVELPQIYGWFAWNDRMVWWKTPYCLWKRCGWSNQKMRMVSLKG